MGAPAVHVEYQVHVVEINDAVKHSCGETAQELRRSGVDSICCGVVRGSK